MPLSPIGQKLVQNPPAPTPKLQPIAQQPGLQTMRPLPGATISQGTPAPRSPFAQLAQKVLPTKVFNSLDKHVLQRISPIGRAIAPTFSDQMKTALEEDRTRSTSQLVSRAKELDTSSGLARTKFGLVDPTGIGGSMKREGVKATKGILAKAAETKAFKDFTDLSTKLLGKLEGKGRVSKQYIADLTNAPDLKQPERDLIRRMLETEGDVVDVPTFAQKVKKDLLPLDRNSVKDSNYGSGNRYESVNLPDELRGPVANYQEHIYGSPIKTSAGLVHFNGQGADNYFAHTRVEDMAPKPKLPFDYNNPDAIEERVVGLSQPERGDTRRVIEVQSDLFQKGRLEGENQTLKDQINNYTRDASMRRVEVDGIEYQTRPVSVNGETKIELMPIEYGAKSKIISKEEFDKLPKTSTRLTELENKLSEREKELSQLEPYRNTWHERIVREEVKRAAQDGKTKLQFPTGETAMKIEGLGDNNDFTFYGSRTRLTPDQLFVGDDVENRQGSWIVTDVLGDGKFKAVPERELRRFMEAEGISDRKDAIEILLTENDNAIETFDISGKVDTENPIYKFYEKEMGKYLKNKYGAQKVTDERGVTWWEVPVKPDYAKKPVEAFAGGVAGIEDEDGDGRPDNIDPMKAALGIAGVGALSGMAKAAPLRAGQPPIGASAIKRGDEWVQMDEVVARERFNIPALKKLSFGGSDRDVYDLGDGNVLKVSKSARGLDQNAYSADHYAESSGLIPKTIEVGKNYIVKEKVLPPDARTKKVVKDIQAAFSKYNVWSNRYDIPNALNEVAEKYAAQGDDEIAEWVTGFADYDILINDLTAIRNWGTTLDGMPVHLDEGTLNKDVVENSLEWYRDSKGYKVTRTKKSMDNPAFREIYDQSRAAKKFFGDTDSKTMYGAGGVAGIEDEDGDGIPDNVDPVKAALGIAGVGSLSKVDQLIAQNKIRVVSRNGKDVYQVKKRGQWANVRDEDSAVRQVEAAEAPKPKLVPKTNTLADEAAKLKKQGKTLEDFINKQGEVLYHGTPYKFDDFKTETTTFFTPRKDFAYDYGSDKSMAREMDADVQILERYGRKDIKLFDPRNKEDIDKLEKELPDEVDVLGAMFGLGGKLPKQEVLQRMQGIFTHDTPDFAKKANKVGEIFDDMSIKHEGWWRIKEIKPTSVVAEKIEHPGYAKDKNNLRVWRTEEFPRQGTYQTKSEPYWRDFEGDANIEKAIKKLGYDGWISTEKGVPTYAIFKPEKLYTRAQLEQVWNNVDVVPKLVPKPRQQAELPQELEERKLQLEIRKEALDNDPAASLAKYAATRGDYKGQLKEVTGGANNSKFGQRGDDIAGEAGFEDTETARKAYEDWRLRKADYEADLADFKEASRIAREEIRAQKLQSPKTQPAQSGPKADLAAKLDRAEVASLETVADQLREAAPLPPDQKPLSLEKIVTQTPVGKKANLLSFVRTPDRVLKKMGMANEARLLRNQYEKYVKELPKNIDTITAWTKRVPRSSNERLFRYLDGEQIKLGIAEQKVADEIKEYLSTWADRLKLPADRRISHYITHLFDDQLIQKEFDEDLAKIIADRVPGQVYDPFLEKRLGAKGYKMDVWKALDAYTKRATRKVHMDVALEQIRARAGETLEMSNLEKSQFEFIQSYINGINMRPTWLDNMLDNTVKDAIGYKLGQRPTMNVLGLLRRMTYRAFLGLNPGSALRNLSQGVNTYAILGERDTIIGYSKLFSPSARAELAREGVLDNTFIQDRSLSATKKLLEKADKALWFFFDTAEKINRGSAYLGAKSKALRAGKSEEEAIEYAKSIVRKTQFNYDPIDTPVAFQSDVMKSAFQFQTFTTKQTEFMFELLQDRNFAGMMRYALAGYAFVYTIGQAFDMEPHELLPIFRFDVPVSMKFPWEAAKAIMGTEDKYGNERSLERKLKDVGKTLYGLVPAGSQIKKSYEGYQAVQAGQSETSNGRKQFEVGGTPAKDAQAILFGKYANEEAKNYFDGVKTPEQELKAKKAQESADKREAFQPTYDKIKELSISGREEEAQEILNKLSDEDYETFKKIRAAERAKNTETFRLKLELDPADAVLYLRSLPEPEGMRILNLMEPEEYARFELGKQSL